MKANKKLIWLCVALIAVNLANVFLGGCKSVEPLPVRQFIGSPEAVTSATSNVTEARAEVSRSSDALAATALKGRAETPVAAQAKLYPLWDSVTAESVSLIGVSTRLTTALDELQRLKTASESAQKTLDALDARVSKAEKAVAAEKEQRVAAETKYHDAWLGGKAWRTIYWISGISLTCLFIGLILNAKTDIFVLPVKIVGNFFAWLFK